MELLCNHENPGPVSQHTEILQTIRYSFWKIFSGFIVIIFLGCLDKLTGLSLSLYHFLGITKTGVTATRLIDIFGELVASQRCSRINKKFPFL